VHGIAVSGPTFPATIWKDFMEPALRYAPFPTAFPVAKTQPVWRSRTLQYAMSGGYSPTYSSGTYAAPQQQARPSSNNQNQGFVQVPNNGKQP